MNAKPDWFRTYEIVGVVFWWSWFVPMLASMGTGLDGWITRTMFVLLMLVSVCPIHVQVSLLPSLAFPRVHG